MPLPDSTDGVETQSQLMVRIIATSDLHASLWPYDYLRDAPTSGQGLAALAPTIEALRHQVPHSLLFDNGDLIEGTPLADYAAANPDIEHPMITAMNMLGFDAAVPGNHDFDFGIDTLRAALDHAQFPFVLSNLSRSDGSPFLPRSVVLERTLTDSDGVDHDLRIGVIGLTPPETLAWDRAVLRARLRAEAAMPAARLELIRLREVEKVDLTIALCHSGIDLDTTDVDGENTVIPLAATGLVDAIIAGHTHQRFPASPDSSGGINGIPVVQPAPFGSEVGVIDLDLKKTGSGWEVSGFTSQLVSADADHPDKTLLELTEPAHQATNASMARAVGYSHGPLVGYFDLFAGCCLLGLVAEVQRKTAAILIENMGLGDLPLLSSANPLRAGGHDGRGKYTDIPAGPLSMRHVHDLYAYSNRLTILKIDGAGLKAWLERAARMFNRIEPGKDGQSLINFAIAGYTFDVIDGLRYEIDVTTDSLETDPNGPGRIRNLMLGDTPVGPQDEFFLATSSYRAAGGGGYGSALNAKTVLETNLLLRDLIRDYICAEKEITPEPLNVWRFSDAGGTSVIAETGPGAASYGPLVETLGLTLLGTSPEGRARFELII